MSGEAQATSTAQKHRAGRTVGVFDRWVEDRAFGFFFDAAGAEYFVHVSGFDKSGMTAESLGTRIGDVFSFAVTETSKGLRAHSVQEATPQEIEAFEQVLEAKEESHGNR
jgi:cold shock CspA family protein